MSFLFTVTSSDQITMSLWHHRISLKSSRSTLFQLQEFLQIFCSQPLILGGVQMEQPLHLDHMTVRWWHHWVMWLSHETHTSGREASSLNRPQNSSKSNFWSDPSVSAAWSRSHDRHMISQQSHTSHMTPPRITWLVTWSWTHLKLFLDDFLGDSNVESPEHGDDLLQIQGSIPIPVRILKQISQPPSGLTQKLWGIKRLFNHSSY